MPLKHKFAQVGYLQFKETFHYDFKSIGIYVGTRHIAYSTVLSVLKLIKRMSTPKIQHQLVQNR